MRMREKAIVSGLSVFAAVSSVSAGTYTWNGSVANGIWGQSAVSQPNWLDETSSPIYNPSNGGGHTFIFAAAGYNTAVTTLTLENHNPNINSLVVNGNATTPFKFVVDGSNVNNHFDFAPATSGAETLTVSSTGHEIASVNGGQVVLQSNDENAWRVSGGVVFTVSAPISANTNARNISKRGGGTLRLTGLNTFGGTLTAGDGTIEINSLFDRGVPSAAGTGLGSTDGRIQIGRTTSLSHLNGSLTYTGAETSSNRAILIAKDTRETPGVDTARLTSTTGTLTLSGGITATTGGLFDHFVDFTVGGAGNIVLNEKSVFGDLNVIKSGAGRVEVNVDSLWRGTTTVSGGTLLINANHTVVGGGAYQVQAGGTLGGSGAIAGAITVNEGGVLSPGNAGGTLDVGAVTLNGTLAIDLLGTGIAGTVVTSDLFSIGETATLAINGAEGLEVGATYTIIDTPGLLSGTFADLPSGTSFESGFYTYEIRYAGGDVTLTVTAVPEPTTMALLSIGGLALLRRRRSR